MAKIFPFQSFHYNTPSLGNLSNLITPPYDNIPAGDEAKFWQRSPYNFSHIDLPKRDEDDYSGASQTLTQWIERKILVRDSSPGYYWYRQTFSIGGVNHSREALMCAVQLTDFSENIVRPHENTHGKAKRDRLQSLRATRFNLSHIFGMVKDAEGVLSSVMTSCEFQAPLLQGKTDDGAEHTVWKIELSKAPQIAPFFADKPIYIVDGHHRYESALAYAREVGAYGDEQNPAGRTLFTICNGFDPGLVVMPTHRGVKSLGSHKSKLTSLGHAYDLKPINVEALKTFCDTPINTPSFVLGFGETLYACTPKGWENAAASMGQALYKLPMHWSDRKILSELLEVPEADYMQRIDYEKDALKMWNERSRYDLMVFHARPKTTDVTDIADDQKFMPPKSTYFYPKLASGLVLRQL